MALSTTKKQETYIKEMTVRSRNSFIKLTIVTEIEGIGVVKTQEVILSPEQFMALGELMQFERMSKMLDGWLVAQGLAEAGQSDAEDRALVEAEAGLKALIEAKAQELLTQQVESAEK